MASLTSDPVVTNTDRLPPRRKRKKKKSTHNFTLHKETEHQNQMINNNNKWRTATEERNYSSNLIQALRHVHANDFSTPTSSASISGRGRAVRNAADRVLAMSAKGRTRWSRAILTNKLKLKLKFVKAKKPKAPTGKPPKARSVVLRRRKVEKLPAVQKKARVLRKLVPGCKKQPLAVVLDEAGDYISALEMQVRAMTALVELLSVAGALSGYSDPPPPGAVGYLTL